MSNNPYESECPEPDASGRARQGARAMPSSATEDGCGVPAAPLSALGDLVLTGWVTEDGTPMLLLATPHRDAQQVMPAVCGLLAGATVTLTDDGWIRLRAAGTELTRPSSPEWSAAARTRAQVAVCVGLLPYPPRVDLEDYAALLYLQGAVDHRLVPLTTASDGPR